ncbi:hypothetical protein PCASD_25736 [Puccinia coronata f. sp. avenae]|uniref:RING-type domain-containing protein n=2 Tax=Puccinia coronata f. sp. avenae TaxID=200324 RepID=A0A2N5S0B9_9BASI|nr:hypothetical protein PCASD_25736 [Puccinia coronata f. sp. avenae]
MPNTRVIVLPTCSICQDEDAGRQIIATLCGHVFHLGCLTTWDQRQFSLRTATKCPSCNITLRRAGSPITPARFITLHSLNERDIDDRGVSHTINPAGDPNTEARLRTCLEELDSLKESIREREARIRQLTLEPVALRREKDNLTASLMLLSQTKQALEERAAKYMRELRMERKERQEEHHTRVLVDKKAKIELDKLNEKCRIAKSEGEQLQERLAIKISENEELQSFVAEFGREKIRFHGTESALRAQLEDSIEKFKSVKSANQVYKTKLEEAKKKISLLEERVGISGRAVTGSVRRCTKFYPDVSKSSIHPTGVVLRSTSRGADTSAISIKRLARDANPNLSHESSKRLRSTHTAGHHHSHGSTSKQPYHIEITSEPEDSALPSSSTLQSSPIQIRAEKDLFLPSLFGKPLTPHSRQSRIQLPQQLKSHQPVASSSTIKISKSSDKLLALGPKIRHR